VPKEYNELIGQSPFLIAQNMGFTRDWYNTVINHNLNYKYTESNHSVHRPTFNTITLNPFLIGRLEEEVVERLISLSKHNNINDWESFILFRHLYTNFCLKHRRATHIITDFWVLFLHYKANVDGNDKTYVEGFAMLNKVLRGKGNRSWDFKKL
jgi:hypothetical protein